MPEAAPLVDVEPFDAAGFLAELGLADQIDATISYKGRVATLGSALVDCEWARGVLLDAREDFREAGVEDIDTAMKRKIERMAPKDDAIEQIEDSETVKKN